MKQYVLTTFCVVLIEFTWAVSENDVQFNLYKQDEPEKPIPIGLTNVTQLVDLNAAIFVITHGWLQNPQIFWIPELKNALFSQISHQNSTLKGNVIVVNWGGLANNNNYFQAAADTQGVGKILAQLIVKLTQKGLSPKHLHLIGHSLGAQVSGIAGFNFQKATGAKIGRITGLEPAGPNFTGTPTSQRLDPSDAEVVIVIHSDAGVEGYPFSCGSVDFWPNGGIRIQPGCPDIPAEAQNTTGIESNALILLNCSHLRSVLFYLDAIKVPNSLIGTKCGNYLIYLTGVCSREEKLDMGGFISSSVTGDYFLTTRGSEPYGKGA